MTTFKDIENGFKKKGVGLSLPEKKGIRNFFKSDIISPAFIRKMVEKYGGESVSDAFGMNDPDHPVLEYLLRRYKGRFYRNVYPSVGLTNLEG